MRAKDVQEGDEVTLFGTGHTVAHRGDGDDGQVKLGLRMSYPPREVAVMALLELPPEFELHELCDLAAAVPRDVENAQDASYIIEHPALFDETEVTAARETLTSTSQFASQD